MRERWTGGAAVLGALACLALVVPGRARASAPGAAGGGQQMQAAELMQQVGIDQNLGATLPAGLTFTDSEGRDVRLGDLFGDRPVILALVYYECPMLCTVTTEGLLSALRPLGLEPGKDFDVVTVSIDPGETPQVAAAKKAAYVEEYGRHREGAAGGWHALTGDAGAVAALADAVGFRYVYDEERDMYAHAAGIVVVTPGRELARYFYGVVYPTRDLRLALVEASGGTVGNVADQVLLLCYQYDPVKGKYGFVVWGAVRVLGVVTVLALVGFIAVMLRRERRGDTSDSGDARDAGSTRDSRGGEPPAGPSGEGGPEGRAGRPDPVGGGADG